MQKKLLILLYVFIKNIKNAVAHGYPSNTSMF